MTKLNLTALVAAIYAMYDKTIGAAIQHCTNNGSSKSIFLHTVRWAFWKANETSTGKTTADFLETVPREIRGNVRGAILRVEAYFNNPKYAHVPLATLGINTLANAIRVMTGLGTADQPASFSFAKGQVAHGLLAISTAIDKVIEPSDDYTKAQVRAQIADVFRTMPSAEAQVMYHFLTSPATDADGLMAVLRYYLAEGTDVTDDEGAMIAIGDERVPSVLGGFETGIPAAYSVVPATAIAQVGATA